MSVGQFVGGVPVVLTRRGEYLGEVGREVGKEGGRDERTCSLLLRKTMKTVSTSSGILLKMKSITHRPDAPSP